MKTSFRNHCIKRAVFVPLFILSASLVQAQTTNSNNLTVLGYIDVTNDISYGNAIESGTTNSAVSLNYNDTIHEVGFLSSQPSSLFIWQDNGFGTSANKMGLDGSNNLTLYNTNGSSGIIFNPNSGGGITLANSGSSIVFADGTVLSSANFLNNFTYGVPSYNAYSGLSGIGDTASGYGSLALGFSSWATQAFSVAIGTQSSAGGAFSMALGEQANASGNSSTALGSQTTASGTYSTAFGQSTTASGTNSTAFGYNNIASGTFSVVSGSYNTASGRGSVAFGSQTTASGEGATALGIHTVASGFCSSGFGFATQPSGPDAATFGQGSIASGYFTTAFGFYTKAVSIDSVALGQQNVGLVGTTNGFSGAIAWIPTDPILEVGNGAGIVASDSFVLRKNGELRTGGLIQSQSGVRIPQTGDMSMGSFAAGNNPATLIETNGLTYPGGN